MALYKKLAIVVQADIIDTPQYVTTLEGVSEGHPGDYLVTGIDNEQWFVCPKWFHSAYTHIKGNLYQREPQVLQAVQITKPDKVSAPTGDINGMPGDYKVTGKKGEQWFVKPDIFEKTYKKIGGDKPMKQQNNLQKAIDQIGEINVLKYLPKGMKLHGCDIHGKFLAHYKENNPLCPLCSMSANAGEANGTTASQVELFINLTDAVKQSIPGVPSGNTSGEGVHA